MRIVSPKDTRTRRAPEEWFTGKVWLDPAPAGSPDAGAFRVHFVPGAHTNWHTHPEGQILHILTSNGGVQQEGGTQWLEPATDEEYSGEAG